MSTRLQKINSIIQRHGEKINLYLKKNNSLTSKKLAELIVKSEGLNYSTKGQSIFCRAVAKYRKEKHEDIKILQENPETGQMEWRDLPEGGREFNYVGKQAITTKKQAIEFWKLDTSKNDYLFDFGSWDVTMKGPDGLPIKATNYRHKIKEFPKQNSEKDLEELLQKCLKKSLSCSGKLTPANIKTKKSIGVVGMADFHLGAYVSDLIKTPDFSYTHIINKLKEIVEIINKKEYSEVYLFLNGDFIESFSGLNHANSWKGLAKGAHGMGSVVLAHEVLKNNLYSKINNLKYIGFISGNHDRTSPDKNLDDKGEVAYMMEYLCRNTVSGIKTEWNPIVISKTIDGINYLVTHAHLNLAKKDSAKILFDYGVQGIYNVILKGHTHSRDMKKVYKGQMVKYQEENIVFFDQLDYRIVVLPPIFTGNFYSESLGYTSSAGFNLFENNGKGKPNMFDYCV